jgi:hypothetical protein
MQTRAMRSRLSHRTLSVTRMGNQAAIALRRNSKDPGTAAIPRLVGHTHVPGYISALRKMAGRGTITRVRLPIITRTMGLTGPRISGAAAMAGGCGTSS